MPPTEVTDLGKHMSIWLIALLIFLCVAGMVLAGGTIAEQWRAREALKDRLDTFTGAKKLVSEGPNLLREPIGWESKSGLAERFSSPTAWLKDQISQADLNFPITTFLLIAASLACAGCVAALVLRIPKLFVPAGSLLGLLPFVFLYWRRIRRLKKFGEQLPDALELMARAIRAGHTLQAGMQMVSDEMPPPIGVEFHRTYEEQNLGVSLDAALQNLGNRVPNVDLGFFVTAVSIQRQTGGDLSEILDKLGYIIRERFKIFGQVAALTAEGRLSGWILIALPLLIFAVLMKLNRGYLMLLFTDPLGHKMLLGAGILQIVGALVIQKIVKIRV